MNLETVARLIERLYGPYGWPSPFHVMLGLQLRAHGVAAPEAARRARTTTQRLQSLASSDDPVRDLLGATGGPISEGSRYRARQGLSQLLVGRAAEAAFEQLYRSEAGVDEFELTDLREGRSDTDYRLLNGRGRPLYRINIKFIGSTFRRAPELVGLMPDDCFPLATYKIFNALKKQDQEHLPYIFLVVFARHLSVDVIGSQLPKEFVKLLTLMVDSPKRGLPRRNIEDQIVSHMAKEQAPAYAVAYNAIRSAHWYVLSARKADRLLRELLFERVYALKIRGFAQQFRGAELDMHFSLQHDLVPLTSFLKTLRDDGQGVITSMLERGTI